MLTLRTFGHNLIRHARSRAGTGDATAQRSTSAVRRALWTGLMMMASSGAASATWGQVPAETVPAPPSSGAEPRVLDQALATEAEPTVDLAGQPVRLRPLTMRLVLAVIPEQYENRKRWGRTREVWDGVKIRFDDGKLKTKRRKKSVNHGSWSRYRLALIEPEKNLHVVVENFHALDEGKAAFDVTLSAKLDVLGQIQEWNRGVKMLSVTTEATADVRLLLSCTLATQLDITRIPPDLVFLPEVSRAELQLADLKLHRVSKADGPIIREASWSVEQWVRDELKDDNAKLVGKINRQIDKNKDKLRFSMTQLVREHLLGQGEQDP